MGLFHCPMGALYRDGDPCIDCGLCEAKTKEDMIEAIGLPSEKLCLYCWTGECPKDNLTSEETASELSEHASEMSLA